MRFLLAMLVLLSLVPLDASAQGRVSIEDFTVDGDPPPDAYRTILANGIRPSLEEIRTLYARRLAERPGLSGDYRLRMWVSNREVIRITPESSIGDATLEEQTRQAIYRFRLPPEAPAGGTWVRFVVRFTAPAASPATTPGTGTGSTTGSTAGSTGSTAGSSTGSTTGSGGLTAVPPTASVSSLRAPSIRVDSIRGALAESALVGTLPVPALEACVTSPRGGTFRVSVSISRRGRVTASTTAGTFRHAGSIACIERAIESLTMSPDAGPTRARITVTVPAAP